MTAVFAAPYGARAKLMPVSQLLSVGMVQVGVIAAAVACEKSSSIAKYPEGDDVLSDANGDAATGCAALL